MNISVPDFTITPLLNAAQFPSPHSDGPLWLPFLGLPVLPDPHVVLDSVLIPELSLAGEVRLMPDNPGTAIHRTGFHLRFSIVQ